MSTRHSIIASSIACASGRIHNCFDSHVHFLATGQIATGLKLHDLKSARDIEGLKIQSEHFRSHWLTGFGWDHNKWGQHNKKSLSAMPTKSDLDRVFPDKPVLFSRVDGHASWVNSKAIEELTSLGLRFDNPSGNDSATTGILLEQDHIKALAMLPAFSQQQLKTFLQKSMQVFHAGGFTHVRDLSMNLQTWQILNELFQQKSLLVCIESFVTCENLNHLPSVFDEIKSMKEMPCPYLRVNGVKIFVDGSLGSKTAYVSGLNLGKALTWPSNEIKEVMTQTWKNGLEVAVHCIGDQAAHEVVLIARQVAAEGMLGRLHLEHVEVLRPETINLMKPLHVTCHLQPCHWLSDHEWLPEVLPKELLPYLFQWELLRKNRIPFFFGSDSPIEKPSVYRTQQALTLSSQSKQCPVTPLGGAAEDWLRYHSHPDFNWTQSWTEFDSGKIVQVFFDGEAVFKS